jgi:leader peptidase (prepilin peptidase) / N-methyltransferase
MAILAAFYLILALISGGGLGAGDVKLGGLLGLTLAWLSWAALVDAMAP